MPAYLCHGFRWQRRSVRVYVVVQNLDDASPEWIIPARSSQCLLESFYNLFDFLPYCVPSPRSGSGSGYGSTRRGGDNSDDESHVFNSAAHGNGTRSRSQSNATGQKSRSQSRTRSRQTSNPPPPSGPPPSQPPPQIPGHNASADVSDELKAQEWSTVKLLEEYNPLNLDEVSRPYAYVADYAVRVDLSVSIFDEMAKYEDRVRADRDPPITGPSSDEGAPGTKKKPSKKQQPGTGWFERLRDQLQRGEEIRWYIVVNGDEVRDWPDEPESRALKLAEAKRPAPTRAQQEHHSQYMLQQQIFEENDGKGHRRLVVTDRIQKVGPSVPEKGLPALKTKMSVDGGTTPKTSSKGGFRRLFGRSKAEDLSP